MRFQFTQKERDNETGLDYFLARYYSSTQGRFTSPDEFKGGPEELYSFADDAADNPIFYGDPDEPQSLNKYQYTYNNPLRYTDPNGHCPACAEVLRDGGTAAATAEVIPGGQGVGLIIAGGTVVVATGILVYQNWDGIKAGAREAYSHGGQCMADVGCPPVDPNTYRGNSGEAQAQARIGGQTANQVASRAAPMESRKQVFKTYPTRKRAQDARPRPQPAKPGEKRVTRQTKNQDGMGTKSEKHERGGRHFHDDRHNNQKRPNKHYGFPD